MTVQSTTNAPRTQSTGAAMSPNPSGGGDGAGSDTSLLNPLVAHSAQMYASPPTANDKQAALNSLLANYDALPKNSQGYVSIYSLKDIASNQNLPPEARKAAIYFLGHMDDLKALDTARQRKEEHKTDDCADGMISREDIVADLDAPGGSTGDPPAPGSITGKAPDGIPYNAPGGSTDVPIAPGTITPKAPDGIPYNVPGGSTGAPPAPGSITPKAPDLSGVVGGANTPATDAYNAASKAWSTAHQKAQADNSAYAEKIAEGRAGTATPAEVSAAHDQAVASRTAANALIPLMLATKEAAYPGGDPVDPATLQDPEVGDVPPELLPPPSVADQNTPATDAYNAVSNAWSTAHQKAQADNQAYAEKIAACRAGTATPAEVSAAHDQAVASRNAANALIPMMLGTKEAAYPGGDPVDPATLAEPEVSAVPTDLPQPTA